jgi:glycogen(starch) synthase
MSAQAPLPIVLGSVLKPVTDVRLYQKIALALAQVPTNQLHIIGNASTKLPENIPTNIQLLPIATFHRTSYQRLLYQFVFWTYLQKIQPQIIIVNTVELLPVIVLYKFFTHKKIKLVYDIMENYYQNIAFQATYSAYYRKPLAWAAKQIEVFCSQWVEKFLLAEKCFLTELQYLFYNQKTANQLVGSHTFTKKILLAENKYQVKTNENLNIEANKIKLYLTMPLHFIYTGTISKAYGLLEGIELLKKVYMVNPTITFTIIGYCTDILYYQQIETALQTAPFVRNFISTTTPIAHENIIAAVKEANVALLPYLPNISTQNRIPTKFYEYIYYQIPMLIPKNKVWEDFCVPYKCAISIDFQQISGAELLHTLYATDFYSQPFQQELVCWGEAESVHLRKFLLEGL